MSGVTYADGKLWAATTTAVGGVRSKRDGVLWWQVRPTFNLGRVGGSVVAQGYVAVATNGVFYPTVSVNASAVGAMIMSIAGPSIFPSLSYISMNVAGITGPVRVPQTGTGPGSMRRSSMHLGSGVMAFLIGGVRQPRCVVACKDRPAHRPIPSSARRGR